MTLEEKVGQLLMVHFHGVCANEEAKELIQEAHIGGIIYYNWSNGLTSPEQVSSLSSSLQKLAAENRVPIPLFIAVDQEGGRVIRLQNGFTPLPSNQSVGLSHNPDLAEENAKICGKELLAVGVNVNFAPVVDILSNPNNPVIGTRSFGNTPEIVSTFAESALKGYKKAGILSTLKHFPGHGDVEIDSHKDLPILDKSLEELEKGELIPFRTLAKSADAIMTAHLLVKAFDTEKCSTLSKNTLRYLREEIGFEGIIISDSLVMEGVLKRTLTVEEAAIQAIEAGCDLLILGGKQLMNEEKEFELTCSDIRSVHQALVEAVKKGRISEERLNEANERLISLKNKFNPENTLSIPPEVAHTIAEKIWHNECKRTIEGLTHWNKGENFASLGIGHFIWYPVGCSEKFEETFPQLLCFLKKEGVTIPGWLEGTQGCPWRSREEFYQHFKSPEMEELRDFLYKTKDLQAIFIVNRFKSTVENILEQSSLKEKIHPIFLRLAEDPRGLYALIDYMNFKGTGIAPLERYNGQGWGLIQVLEKIPPSSSDPVVDFVQQAKIVLTQRVENSPTERDEKKWLNGWFKRLETYLEPIKAAKH